MFNIHYLKQGFTEHRLPYFFLKLVMFHALYRSIISRHGVVNTNREIKLND